MTGDEIGRVFALAEDSFERARASSAKTGRTLARADDILTRAGSRDSAARAAARRERQRLNAGFGRALKHVALAIAAVWVATMLIGLFKPIGMFGLMAAVVAGILLAGAALLRSLSPVPSAAPAPDMPTGQLVDRLDSYLYRARSALPAPAQAEIDALLSALPDLKRGLERASAGEAAVGDARRLVGTHLPNLIDRYLDVPAAYRGSQSDDVTVDQRLVDALRAAREALGDVGASLARGDIAAFETQGRFIESRYGEEPLDR